MLNIVLRSVVLILAARVAAVFQAQRQIRVHWPPGSEVWLTSGVNTGLNQQQEGDGDVLM